MLINLRSSCKCVVFVFALISLAGCNGKNESESTSKDTSAKFKIVQGLESPVPNSLIPFTSPDGKFKISFPRGWELHRNITRSGEEFYQAIHPNGAATIAVHCVPDDFGDKNKIFNGSPVGFSESVSLESSKRRCPNAELLDSSFIMINNVKGVRSLVVCAPYYYDEFFLFYDDVDYQLLTTYLEDDALRSVVINSIATFSKL